MAVNVKSFRGPWGVVAACLALLAVVGLLLWKNQPAPQPPAIFTRELDPQVAALIDSASREVRDAPRSAAAWGKLGSALMHYDFVEESLMALARAEQLARSDPRWPYLQALLLIQREPKAALIHLRRAVSLRGPNTDVMRLRLARFLAERGRDEEASGLFQALIKSKPNHSAAWLGLARLHWAQEQPSANDLTNCLNDIHTAKAAYALLATIHQTLENPSAAAEAARQSRLLPEDEPWPDPYWEEASVYRVGRKSMLQDAAEWMDQGHWAEALAVLNQETQIYPKDDEGWYLLGWGLNRQQRPLEAEAALREHLQRSPESAKGLSQLAVALLNQKREEDAVEILEKALHLKPTWRELHFNLAFACQKLGREPEAIRHLQDALKVDPSYVSAYAALADLLAGRGQRDEARKLLGQALQISPSDPRAHKLLSELSGPPKTLD